MKTLVATVKHETNTYSLIVTYLKGFEEWGLDREQRFLGFARHDGYAGPQ